MIQWTTTTQTVDPEFILGIVHILATIWGVFKCNLLKLVGTIGVITLNKGPKFTPRTEDFFVGQKT